MPTTAITIHQLHPTNRMQIYEMRRGDVLDARGVEAPIFTFHPTSDHIGSDLEVTCPTRDCPACQWTRMYALDSMLMTNWPAPTREERDQLDRIRNTRGLRHIAGRGAPLSQRAFERRELVPLAATKPVSAKELSRRKSGLPGRMYTARKFGVEIEFLAPHDQRTLRGLLADDEVELSRSGAGWDDRGWTLKQDGSIRPIAGVDPSDDRGHELVSPPSRSFDQLSLVCASLRNAGAYANSSCGLHVHLDATGLLVDDVRRFIMLYATCEKAIDSIMPSNRRNNNSDYAHSLLTADAAELDGLRARLKNCKNVRDICTSFHGRYWKVNMQAYVVHGTIEVRQHAGSVDFLEVKNWIELLDMMMLFAQTKAEIPTKGLRKIEEMFDLLIEGLSSQEAMSVKVVAQAPQRPTPPGTFGRALDVLEKRAQGRAGELEENGLPLSGQPGWRQVKAHMKRVMKQFDAQGLPDADELSAYYMTRSVVSG